VTDEELRQLIAEGEGPYLDFKDARMKPSTLARTLVAFANTAGGRVVVGVDESTHAPTGIPNREETLDNIHRAASLDCCQPAVNISVEERTYQGQLVFLVTVPYQYQEMFSTEGRVLVRRGTENVSAAPHEITALASRRGRLRYEMETPKGATVDDLNLDLLNGFRAAYQEKRRRRLVIPDMSLLESLGAVVERNGGYHPTVAGILVFGKAPQRFVPQSRMVIVRYPGVKITRNILDSLEIEGTLPEMVDRATDYVGEHVQIGSIRDVMRFGPRREDIPEYPVRAIREIIINALAHREYQMVGSYVIVKWFTDRMEIGSPGGFPEPITPETIYTTRPVHRNPNIMKILYGYGYVEGFGDGVHVIRELYETHLLKPPLPRFEEVPGGVIVTAYAADMGKITEDERAMRWAEMGLSERQVKGLLFVETHGGLSRSEYERLTNVSSRTAHRDLGDLVRRGFLEMTGTGRDTHYVPSAR